MNIEQLRLAVLEKETVVKRLEAELEKADRELVELEKQLDMAEEQAQWNRLHNLRQFRVWLVEHMYHMVELSRAPNIDEYTPDYCGRVVRLAGARASLFGFTGIYRRCRVKEASPEEARELLAACFSCCEESDIT